MAFSATLLNVFPGTTITEGFVAFGTYTFGGTPEAGNIYVKVNAGMTTVEYLCTTDATDPAAMTFQSAPMTPIMMPIDANSVTVVFKPMSGMPAVIVGQVNTITIAPPNGVPIVITFPIGPMIGVKVAAGAAARSAVEVPHEWEPAGEWEVKTGDIPAGWSLRATSFVRIIKPNGTPLDVPPGGHNVELKTVANAAGKYAWALFGGKKHSLGGHRKRPGVHLIKVEVMDRADRVRKTYVFARPRSLVVKDMALLPAAVGD